MLTDLRLAVRQLVRQPLVSGAIVVLIALGVAVNTALFSVIDGLLFKPLPFRAPDRLVAIGAQKIVLAAYGRGQAERLDLKNAIERTPLLSQHAYVVPGGLFESGAGAVGELGLVDAVTTPELFDTFGIRPLLGQAFRKDDSARSEGASVLVGFDLWRSRFGGDPTIVSRTLSVAGRRLLVVGVMPREFDFPRGANVWAGIDPRAADQAVPNFGRLAPGVTIEQLQRQFPAIQITPLREFLRPKGAFTLGFLLAATALVLLVAWVQVAGLQFARAAGRATEIGVRLALGAGRWRLLRQFGAEGFVLAACALGLAWSVTPALTAIIVRLLPPDMTRGQHTAADLRTFGCACLASAVGVLLFAILPLGVIRRSGPSAALRETAAGTMRATAVRTRTVMLVIQLAVTTTLLYVAGLAFHSFARVTAVDLGFVPDRVMAVSLPALTDVSLARGGPTGQAAPFRPQFAVRQQRVMETLDAISRTPGVADAAAATTYPLTTGATFIAVRIRTPSEVRSVPARMNYVTPRFFRTLGMHIVEGEGFQGRPVTEGRTTVAVVNETLARTLRAYGPVIGTSIGTNLFPARIVGVVHDSVDDRPDLPTDPQVYLPSDGNFALKLLVRTAGDSGPMAPKIQTVLKRIWGTAADRRVVNLEEEMTRATAAYRARTILLGLLAVMGLPMALVGVAGSLTYAVRQRTREIGIRIALGAEPRWIRHRVVAQALGCVAAGLLVGLVGGVAAGRWGSSLLFGVQPLDVTTIASVALLLSTTAWLAAFLPARGAARVDPAVALREE